MRVATLFYILFLSVADLICVLPAASQQSIIIQGTVSDCKSGERLVGATVSMKDRLTGTVTDKEGTFRLTGVLQDSLKLLFSYVGYETAEVSVSSADEYLHILLSENAIIGNEVVVSASRINEKILEAPVTVLKLDAIAVRETPSENFYASLGNYKEWDVLYQFHSL
jgi:hypothetical protein